MRRNTDELRFLKLSWIIGFVVLLITILTTGCVEGNVPLAPEPDPAPVECVPGERIDLPDGGFVYCDPKPEVPDA